MCLFGRLLVDLFKSKGGILEKTVQHLMDIKKQNQTLIDYIKQLEKLKSENDRIVSILKRQVSATLFSFLFFCLFKTQSVFMFIEQNENYQAENQLLKKRMQSSDFNSSSSVSANTDCNNNNNNNDDNTSTLQ